MKAALADAIKRIKDAGFSHIKVELEGDIGRDGERDCVSCDTSGRVDCDTCIGEGYVGSGNYTRVSDEEVLEECEDCYGEGNYSCSECDGEGTIGSFRDEDDCDSFMRDYVRIHKPEALSRLTFGKFYEDGSVDSEFTFTLPVEHVEDVIVWTEAFKALADECGDGEIDVAGAGLHISVLPKESNGAYPVQTRMDSNKTRNFCEQMRKLLPALFFLASSDYRSRSLEYRHPQIHGSKYSAISTHDGTCFEYRVFETCYQKPELFFDYIQVIANSLKFFADPTLTVEAIGKQFGFTNGDSCARFFETPDQLRILNSTVKHLKPKDKSFKKLKEERGVRHTISSLRLREQVKIRQLREDYKTYREEWIRSKDAPFTQSELMEIQHLIDNNGISRGEAEKAVRNYRGNTRLITLREFLDKNLPNPLNFAEERITV